VKDFAPYVLRLADLVEQSSDRRRSFNMASIAPALDGEPSRVLRDLVDLTMRREHGAFFSGSDLGACLTKKWKGEISQHSVVCDPACGGGDLLLAIAKLLPVSEGLKETLDAWGRNLRGIDIHGEFVASSKYRLALQAIASGAARERVNRDDILGYFPGVQRGDGLQAKDEFAIATHIVTNPPFSSAQTPKDCEWTSGRVNSAALFMDTIVCNATSSTRIWAILPDVLRSGTRYEQWRHLIDSRLRGIEVTTIGQFSRHADIDVFVLEGIVRSKVKKSNVNGNPLLEDSSENCQQTLGDLFTVRVGPVVPHRHPSDGKKVPYLTPHNCPAWKRVTRIEEYRGFTGTLYKPPFVVLRRTSRSDDPYRAIGTIITDKREVAIENHLLILVPKSGTIADCKTLLQVLKSKTTNNWLNNRICCRHLTVSSVNSIPWNVEAK
jgi:hypothetical protein